MERRETYFIDFHDKKYIIPSEELTMMVHDTEEFVSPSHIKRDVDFAMKRQIDDGELELLKKECFSENCYTLIGHLLATGSLERFRERK